MDRDVGLDWFAQPKNLTIFFLLITLFVMTITLGLGVYSVTHAPSGYETQAHAAQSYDELRTRINNDLSIQHTTDTNFTNQFVGVEDHLDTLDLQIQQLYRVQHLKPPVFHHHKH